MLKLLVATTNPGKLRDFALAADDDLMISPLADLASIPVPAEDELTFEGNAKLKALYYSGFAPGEIVLADDSGLEVDALQGAPGVRSARFADDLGFLVGSALSIDVRNNQCLMTELHGVAENNRKARYRCVLAAARDGNVLAAGVGSVEGIILFEPRGTGGFGYDPYFAPEGKTESMAELAADVRLQLSHRGRALRDLLPKLRAFA